MLARVYAKVNFDYATETAHWQEIIDHLYLPYDAERGVFVQNDGYLDKELKPISALRPEERPLN